MDLINIRQLAGILGVSVRHVQRLLDTGRLPAPLYIGRCRRWRREEIDAWLAAGAPPAERWQWPAPAKTAGGRTG